MDRSPTQRDIETLRVAFSNGNEALIVMPQANIPTDIIAHALELPLPGAVILIAGGAAKMDGDIARHLAPLFTDGLAELAGSLDALIIDGGTQAGVMALTGQGVAARQYQSALLGVAPAHTVVYPGKIAATQELTQLDPNHSHFVLVDSDEWGSETETMYTLARHFSQHVPSVAVLADGGKIAKDELLYNVRQQRPVVVIEGSGRLADKIASLWRTQPATFSDPIDAEIITQGAIHLFPLSGSSQEFAQLLQSLLAR